MKKILLCALCASASAATFAQADGDRILFEDNFEYLQPWSEAGSAVDNIALDAPDLSTPQVEAVINGDGVYARNFLWDKGYWFMGVNADGTDDNIGWCGTKAVYMGQNFLKFGKTDVQARLKVKPDALNINLTDDEYLVIEFDWTPWRSAEGVYDEVSLDIEFFPEASEFIDHDVVAKVATHKLADNTPMAWQHVTVDMSEYDIQPTHFFVFTPSKEYYGERTVYGVSGVHRWAIDNIKFIARNINSGISNVTVDSNAAKEYFNLNGVRVENPENGLYIVRQGSKVSKEYIK